MSEAPALAGRREEIAALTRAVESLYAGRGTVLEVAGDPGIGKTALLNLLARLAAERGATVLRARARSGEAKPYQVFRDAWKRAAPPTAGLRPPAAGAGPPWDTASDHELVRALLDGCARRDGGRGSVLVLDDLHHADPASARLVEALAEECAARPLVLAFALRPRQTPPALLAALDAASHTGHLLRVEPAPLDATAIASLADCGSTAIVASEGKKWEEQADDLPKCQRNSGDTVLQVNRTITYTVSVKVNASLTADLSAALKAAVGTELNTTMTKSYGLTTSLNPGQSIGLYIEYQTNVHAITTTSSAGQTTQLVNVTAPTGVVTARSC
ncbi:DUF6426 family protein [Streptomyces sp. AB3(2024)]|uniref:DUF6426 family protein n=1 Tax=Streptomyces sp. AB3(2024) TaxID=3317321 RepID=UPI0035A3A4BB